MSKHIDMTCPRCQSADWQSNLKETHGRCNSCGLRFAHPNPPAHRPAPPREFADRPTSAEAKIARLMAERDRLLARVSELERQDRTGQFCSRQHKELRYCPYCQATGHDLDDCPERWRAGCEQGWT